MARTTKTRRRGRGRRGSFSRELILETGLRLVQREGRKGLTMRAVADELGTGPMSLYKHVRDKDDLLEGIALLFFERIDLQLGSKEPWPERLRGWMHSMRDQLLEIPEVLEFARRKQFGSPLLLRTCGAVARILVDAGLDDRRAVEAAQGMIWSAIGFVLLDVGATQLAVGETPEVQLAAALASLEPGERAPIEHFVPYIATRRFDALYTALVDQLIAGVERAIAESSGVTRTGIPLMRGIPESGSKSRS
jgi:AcrR family transcriptional regulator